jgi:biopolymer transport protein ExbD
MDEKEFDYLNVIPLVDVMLVLLTIVLTTSTFIASGAMPLALPKAANVGSERLKSLTIDVAMNGALSYQSQTLSLDLLGEVLRPLAKNTPVLIRADRDIQLQRFVDVLDVVKGEGFTTIRLQTERKP